MLRFVVLVVLFAGAVYLFVRFMDRRGTPRRPRPRKPPGRRMIAPDDDEQFLRGLAKEKKKDTEKDKDPDQPRPDDPPPS